MVPDDSNKRGHSADPGEFAKRIRPRYAVPSQKSTSVPLMAYRRTAMMLTSLSDGMKAQQSLHRRSAARAFEAQPAVAIAGQWNPAILRSEGWILAIRKDVRQFLR